MTPDLCYNCHCQSTSRTGTSSGASESIMDCDYQRHTERIILHHSNEKKFCYFGKLTAIVILIHLISSCCVYAAQPAVNNGRDDGIEKWNIDGLLRSTKTTEINIYPTTTTNPNSNGDKARYFDIFQSNTNSRQQPGLDVGESEWERKKFNGPTNNQTNIREAATNPEIITSGDDDDGDDNEDEDNYQKSTATPTTTTQIRLTTPAATTDETSGDDGETEGSGAGMIIDEEDLTGTPCEQQRRKMSNNYFDDVFIPQCTPDGRFIPIQCHLYSGECWCVDDDGREIPGTLRRRPEMPNCFGTPIKAIDVSTARPSTPVRKHPSTVKLRTQKFTDDFVIIDTTKASIVDVEKKFPENPTSTSTQSGLEIGGKMTGPRGKKLDPDFFLFGQPLIYAGIIAGSLMGLLCIVLLVMFTVYRMRKKDEGSYALGEPRRPYVYDYVKAQSQEFYA